MIELIDAVLTDKIRVPTAEPPGGERINRTAPSFVFDEGDM
jgi:hypothetical protein